MDRETAKALNILSRKINDVQFRLDRYLDGRCNKNQEDIATTDAGLIDVADVLSSHDEAITELAGLISDIAESEV